MKKKISILGSTGSVGLNSLKIFNKNKKIFQIYALSADKNYKLICDQIKKFRPSNEMLTVKLKSNGSTVAMFVLFPTVNGLNIQETVTYHQLRMLPTHILHFLDLIHNTKCSFPMLHFNHSPETGKIKSSPFRRKFESKI